MSEEKDIVWKITEKQAYKNIATEDRPSFSSLMGQAQIEAQQKIAEEIHKLNTNMEKLIHEVELVGEAARMQQ